jgi:hypothetical protein
MEIHVPQFDGQFLGKLVDGVHLCILVDEFATSNRCKRYKCMYDEAYISPFYHVTTDVNVTIITRKNDLSAQQQSNVCSNTKHVW